MLKLTVLGCFGPYPPAGGGTSCYLIRSNTTAVVADFGSGALSRLKKFVDPVKLDAVFLTHLHADHACEIPLLDYYCALGGGGAKLPLYLPDDGSLQRTVIDRCDSFLSRDLIAGQKIVIGDIEITPFAMKHPMCDFALRFSCGSACFTYSGDTVDNENIIASIAGSSVFLCDAAGIRRNYRENGPHLSVSRAAEIAKKVGIKLFLTHFHGEPSEALNEALDVWSDVACVEEGATYLID